VVDAIADDLRKAVLRGELAPGTPLTEADIAGRYDVARPTGKAAIEQLVHDGLFERGAHKSARVVRLGVNDVRDIYTTRAHMEREAVRRLAAVGADIPDARDSNALIAEGSASDIVASDLRFHIAIIDALKSPRTSRIYHSLVTEVTLCMVHVQGRGLLETSLIAGEHAHILDLISRGAGNEAADLLDKHLARARERLVGAIGGDPGPEADLGPQQRHPDRA